MRNIKEDFESGEQKRPKAKALERPRNSHFRGNTVALNSYLSVVTLGVNRLNAPIKRHGGSEWIKKRKKTYLYAARHIYMLPTRDSF